MSIGLNLDLLILAFLGQGEIAVFHSRLWLFVSGSYSKIHDSSPVINATEEFLLPLKAVQKIKTHIYFMLILKHSKYCVIEGQCNCFRSCEYAAPCYPIEVPPNDPRITNRRCIEFFRSSAICGSGQTSVFFDTLMPREQINQLTSYIDASQVSVL